MKAEPRKQGKTIVNSDGTWTNGTKPIKATFKARREGIRWRQCVVDALFLGGSNKKGRKLNPSAMPSNHQPPVPCTTAEPHTSN